MKFIFNLTLTALLLSPSLRAQPAASFVANDRWVAIGDSISQNSSYLKYVELFNVIRYPERPISYVNAGIAGDSTNGALRRFDWDIAPTDTALPTVASIMFGMNDCDRGLYAVASLDDAATQLKRQERIEEFSKNLTLLVDRLVALKIRVILITPSPYDDSALFQPQDLSGVNAALGACAQVARTLAAKYGLALVDLHGPITALMQRLQKNNPAFTIIGGDRVHPGNPGHLVMAYTFLRAQQSAEAFSQIHLKANPLSVRHMRGGEATDLVDDPTKGLSFTYLAKSLPFPVPESAKGGLEWVPFQEELNREELRIIGLTSGRYSLRIDDILVGEYTAEELSSGLDLAVLKTPQRTQAEGVLSLMESRWVELGKLRLIAFMEHCAGRNTAQPLAKEVMETYLKEFEKRMALDPKNWQANFPKNYREWKPEVAQIQAKANKLLQEAYTAAQSRPHKVNLKKNM